MTKQSSLLFLMLILGLIQLTMAGNQPLSLTRNGKSAYRIVIATDCNSNDQYAAELLQKYVNAVSGASLPIVTDNEKPQPAEILVGFSQRLNSGEYQKIKSGLDPDGFLIRTAGKKLVIVGGNHMGTAYGVVRFLEQYLGCRKFSPTVTLTPSNPDIRLPEIGVSDKPVNSFRVVYGNFCKDKEYKVWQRLDNVEDVFADGYYVHTLGKIIPWEKYFTTNPEYFALMNGKRIIDQPCLSNPEVLHLTIEKLRMEMAKQPGKKLWSVSQNDNFSYCQCPECKKVISEEGSPAGPVIRFVNKVAAEFPDKVISTLAYQYSRPAPKVTRPLGNVQIMLCTIELNRAKSIESDPGSAQFLTDIQDWGKISQHIYLWDYTVNFSNHVSPFPNLHVLQPNIQFFTRNGAREHFQQSNTDAGHEFSELKSYLISRLLWNPDINADSVLNQFLDGYYENAAPFIRQYIKRLQEQYILSGQGLDIYGSPVWNADAALSADNMAVYNSYFDQAEAAVLSRPEVLQRVHTARLPIQFAAMEIGKNDMFGPRGWYSEQNGRYILREEMKAMLEKFYASCIAGQVKTLSEAGLSPEDYYKSTLRFIDVKVEHNLAFRKKVEAVPAPSPKYSRGDLAVLTNGVQGANDYKVHWLGWEARDFELKLDLDSVVSPNSISISTLYDPKSWILHPVKIQCQVSQDGISWRDAGTLAVEGDQRKEEVIRSFRFSRNLENTRYVKLSVQGTRSLPAWHPSAGGDSWVFVDEIVVE